MKPCARRVAGGLSLVELLVALAVFAAMAAAAYGGLAQIAATRGALAQKQDRLAELSRAVSTFERDLRQAVARPVRAETGALLPALAGDAARVELTRFGFANPRAEPRSNLQRVRYSFDPGARALAHERWRVLDRAPGATPLRSVLLAEVAELRLRYLAEDGNWRERWPPSVQSLEALPRAVEFRLRLPDAGEIRRLVELPSAPFVARVPPA